MFLLKNNSLTNVCINMHFICLSERLSKFYQKTFRFLQRVQNYHEKLDNLLCNN